MHYDYIAHLETFRDDMRHILPKYEAIDLLRYFPGSTAGLSSHKDMYLTVPSYITKAIVQKYRVDLDMFGYTADDYINKK